MERMLPQIFFALSLLALALDAGGHLAGRRRPAWKRYQQEFYRLESVGEPNAAAKARC